VSDDQPGREDARDTELTDEQLDREAPGVDDAAELEAAEAEVAAEAETDEDKVVAGRTGGSRRRGGRITADSDDEDDEPAATRSRRAARTATRPATREGAGTRSRAAAERARETRQRAWAELLDELGEDGGDLADVVRAGDWETPLRIEAEHLLLAALGDVPLAEVEAEGLPLAVVRSAESATRAAVPEPAVPEESDPGALFLAEAAVTGSGLPLPVPPGEATRLLELLLGEGLEPEEIPPLLDRLPVEPATAVQVAAMAAAAGEEPWP
jgi:hypothetical protein